MFQSSFFNWWPSTDISAIVCYDFQFLTISKHQRHYCFLIICTIHPMKFGSKDRSRTWLKVDVATFNGLMLESMSSSSDVLSYYISSTDGCLIGWCFTGLSSSSEVTGFIVKLDVAPSGLVGNIIWSTLDLSLFVFLFFGIVFWKNSRTKSWFNLCFGFASGYTMPILFLFV